MVGKFLVIKCCVVRWIPRMITSVTWHLTPFVQCSSHVYGCFLASYPSAQGRGGGEGAPGTHCWRMLLIKVHGFKQVSSTRGRHVWVWMALRIAKLSKCCPRPSQMSAIITSVVQARVVHWTAWQVFAIAITLGSYFSLVVYRQIEERLVQWSYLACKFVLCHRV